MNNETVLTDAEIFGIFDTCSDLPLHYDPDEIYEMGRAIEQAVLQSPEVQAWKEKAAMIDLLEQHHGADISILSGGEWEVCGSDIYGIGASLSEAFDAAMEKQP